MQQRCKGYVTLVLLNETYSIKYMFVVMVYQRKFELGITLLQALPFWIYQKPMNWPFLCHIFETCQKEIQFIYKQLLYLRKSGKFIGFFCCCFHWLPFQWSCNHFLIPRQQKITMMHSSLSLCNKWTQNPWKMFIQM